MWEVKDSGPQHELDGQKALKCFHKALQVFDELRILRVHPGYPSALLNISVVYEDRGEKDLELFYRVAALDAEIQRGAPKVRR